MNRPLAGLLVALTLGAGVALGAGAGALLGDPGSSRSPDTAVASRSPTDAASPSAVLPPDPTATPVPSYPPLPTPEPTPELVPAPLTGRLVSPAAARRHVIAVMIDDQVDARPQSGLSTASVVWHAPAEGGIPRYMALFQETTPREVGPVRSSRLYFIAWAAEWKSVYVHVGGSPQALAVLRSRDGRGRRVWDADGYRYEGRYLWRIDSRLAPHNVYTDGKNLRAMGAHVGAEAETYKAAWRFGPDLERDRRPKGGRIVIPYLANRVTYTYDRATNRYLRSVSVEGKQVDAANRSRVAPKNVVIMVMRFGLLNDGTTKQRLEAQYTGGGTAWIATNGSTVKGSWKKASMAAPTRFFGPDGTPLTLTVGQTFIQVVPRGTAVSIRDGTVPPRPPRPAVGGRVDTGGPLPR